MLKGITWWQFSSAMLVVTGVYYLYVFARYYGAEVFGKITSGQWRRVKPDRLGTGENREAEDRVVASAVDQPELFDNEGAGEGGNEQFQLMQRAIGMIRQVIAQGIENKLDRENLLDHLREVLGDYRKLRKTEYEETINQFLIRECASELSLVVGEKELAALWK